MVKRMLLALLVGTAALAPALAQAQRTERAPDDDLLPSPVERATPTDRREVREERRAERQDRREQRPDRVVERPRPDLAVERSRPERDGRPETRRERRFDGDGARFARPDRGVERPADQVFPPRRDREEYRRERRDDRADRRDGRRDQRDDRRDDRGQAGWDRNAYGGGLVWNRGWRNDRRYDWNGFREGARRRYSLPRYYAPQGYGYQYRRFGVGAGLSRSLYQQDYWIDDPYDYRLPPAYGPYRWVRYYDDALLIDLRTGRVIDAVYDIFH